MQRKDAMDGFGRGLETMEKLLRCRAGAVAPPEGSRQLRTAMSFRIAWRRKGGRDMKCAVRAMLMRYP